MISLVNKIDWCKAFVLFHVGQCVCDNTMTQLDYFSFLSLLYSFCLVRTIVLWHCLVSSALFMLIAIGIVP